MDRSNVVTLKAVTYTTDTIGQKIPSYTTRNVFCNVSSVSRDEFFAAGQNGIRAQYRVTMLRYEYQGEKILKYNGVDYRIYRTYVGQGELIDLYVEERAGVSA